MMSRLVSWLCLASLLYAAAADYLATLQYVGSSSCQGTIASGVLLQAGVCLGGVRYSCNANSATVSVFMDSSCSQQISSYDEQFGCTGGGANSASIGCVSSPPALASSGMARFTYFLDAGCNTNAGFYYQQLSNTCQKGVYQYQMVSACDSSSVTVKNCTDSACSQNCVTQTYSQSTCSAGQKLSSVVCPGQNPPPPPPSSSSTGSNVHPKPRTPKYANVQVTSCTNGACSAGCHSATVKNGNCQSFGSTGTVMTFCEDDGTVNQTFYNSNDCSGAQSGSPNLYANGGCNDFTQVNPQYGSTMYTCLLPPPPASTGSDGGGGGGGSSSAAASWIRDASLLMNIALLLGVVLATVLL